MLGAAATAGQWTPESGGPGGGTGHRTLAAIQEPTAVNGPRSGVIKAHADREQSRCRFLASRSLATLLTARPSIAAPPRATVEGSGTTTNWVP